jgi:hypothetical protein
MNFGAVVGIPNAQQRLPRSNRAPLKINQATYPFSGIGTKDEIGAICLDLSRY